MSIKATRRVRDGMDFAFEIGSYVAQADPELPT